MSRKSIEELRLGFYNEDPVRFTYNSLIRQLVERRKSLGLTQRDLSKLTGIKQPQIARVESLEPFARLDTVCKIAYCLGLKLVLEEN